MNHEAEIISDTLIDDICTSLARNEPVRCKLPGWGRVHIDRQLPFLCVYRRPGKNDIGTSRLPLGEASYLLADSRPRNHPQLAKLVREITRIQRQVFDAFLIIELWAGKAPMDSHQAPAFKIFAPRHQPHAKLLEKIQSALLAININDRYATVAMEYQTHTAPPDFKPLLKQTDLTALNCTCLGLEIRPVYRDTDSHELFPDELYSLHHQLAHALKHSFYSFIYSYTNLRPPHYLALGRHTITNAVRETDHKLAAISNNFDLLLHITPINVPSAWQTFQDQHFQEAPEFLYRPRPADPTMLKRQLFEIPLEDIEDPTLAYIFSEKRSELDRRITLLADRNTERFLLGSRQLFGDVTPKLLKIANDILATLAIDSGDKITTDEVLSPSDFIEYAEREIAYYRKLEPQLHTRVELRDDVSGIMVSQGNLLVGFDARVPANRVRATLAHEIGTHALTYFNGSQQPFKELCTGMAGYESLQEGLAILAEYLSGELGNTRLRLLAGRIVAVDMICREFNFLDTFHKLHQHYAFPAKPAFYITMRVFRGGGYTKDSIYLYGLVDILDYIAAGKKLEHLYLGKLSLEFLPYIEELLWRKILHAPRLQPRFLEQEEGCKSLEKLRRGYKVLDMMKGKT